MVAITNPGCNSIQTPRVGYDMPGQGKATMEFVVRMYAMRTAKRGPYCTSWGFAVYAYPDRGNVTYRQNKWAGRTITHHWVVGKQGSGSGGSRLSRQ